MNLHRKLVKDPRNLFLQAVAISLVVAAILIIYWQDFETLFNEALHNEAVSHIILVPLLASYLAYRKRDFIRASLALDRLKGHKRLVSTTDLVGISLCLTAFLLYWYGSYTFYPIEYHILSLLVFVAGIVLLLTNSKTLIALIFPILFLAFLVLPPSSVVYSGGALLANANTQGSYAFLRAVGLPVSLSYSYGAPVIALNTSSGYMEFAVYQASSGVYSLIAFSMFATFLVYVIHGSLVKKSLLLLLGLLVLPILNIARISIIVSAAFWLGEEIAMNVFHTFTGWILIFAGMLLLLLIGEKAFHLQMFARTKAPSPCSECDGSLKSHKPFCPSCGAFIRKSPIQFSKRFWTKAAILLIASFLVTTVVQAPAFAFSQGFVISDPNPEANTSVFPEMQGYNLRFLYRDVQYEKIAQQDANLVYAYMPTSNSSALPVYLIVAVAASVSSLHNWEVSLVAWQTSQGLAPLVTLLDAGDRQLTENPRIISHYIVFRHPSNYTYIALYWYQKALFKTGATIELRYVRMNLLMVTLNTLDSPGIISDLETMGQAIALHWEPMRIQSLFSLAIPVQQFLLASSVSAAVISQASQYALDQKRKRTAWQIFSRLSHPDEKLLLRVVRETGQKTKETTTQVIASAYREAINKPIAQNNIDEMLRTLEKSGLVKTDLTNVLERPRLVWKL